LEFYKEIGLKAALKYGKIKRATLYKWKRKYKEFGIYGLQNGDVEDLDVKDTVR
jgi:transposase-like protein